ncbi:MAG: hypothetical protein Q9195_001846 [Heterodermia aff. obscurata]
MGGKRKRNHNEESESRKVTSKGMNRCSSPTAPKLAQHSTLRLYYPHTVSLTQYLQSRLPSSASKARLRRLSTLGNGLVEPLADDSILKSTRQEARYDTDEKLRSLLNSTLVCYEHKPTAGNEYLERDYVTFSQQSISTTRSSIDEGTASQTEIIDFAIWRLFHRAYPSTNKPPHILCHGYQRARPPRTASEDHCAQTNIPGIASHYPNAHVTQLKSPVWKKLLTLLGKEGDRIMLDLVLECGLFISIEADQRNYYQISGTPLTELRTMTMRDTVEYLSTERLSTIAQPSRTTKTVSKSPRNPAAIYLVRSRMFFARAALNAKGKITFGLRHIRQFDIAKSSSFDN